MSFSRGFKIGLFLLLLGVVLVQASRSLTLCGGILVTMEKPASKPEVPLDPPTTGRIATPTSPATVSGSATSPASISD